METIRSITRFAAFGGQGNDDIMGGDNVDFIYGDDSLNISQANALIIAMNVADADGRSLTGVLSQAVSQADGGMDTIVTYGGDDYIDGGDETVALVTSQTTDGTERQIESIYYNLDGTPLDAADYNNDGTLSNSGATKDALGLVLLQTRHGDLISAGDGIDTVYGGTGYDQINAGAGANLVFAGDGDDIIDARESSGDVYAGAGDDVISWLYEPGSQLAVDGGIGADQLNAVLVDGPDPKNQVPTAQNVHIFEGQSGVAVIVVNPEGATSADSIALTGVESLSLSMKGGADTLQIDDVIGTDLQSIDVDAGSSEETIWLADRDGSNNQSPSRQTTTCNISLRFRLEPVT